MSLRGVMTPASLGVMTPRESKYEIREIPGRLFVVVDGEGNEPSGFGHESRAEAQREIEKLLGNVKQRRLAVVCHDGCGYRGRRLYPGPEMPCPRCGSPVDVGIPTRPAMLTKTGGIGGRTELSWRSWS